MQQPSITALEKGYVSFFTLNLFAAHPLLLFSFVVAVPHVTIFVQTNENVQFLANIVRRYARRLPYASPFISSLPTRNP